MQLKKDKKKARNSKKYISFARHLAEQIENCFYFRAFDFQEVIFKSRLQIK